MYNTEKDVNYNYGKADENTTTGYYTKYRFLRKFFPNASFNLTIFILLSNR